MRFIETVVELAGLYNHAVIHFIRRYSMSRLSWTKVVLLQLCVGVSVTAQTSRWSFGVGGGGLLGQTVGEKAGLDISSKFQPGGYGFVRMTVAPYLQGELNVTAGRLAGTDETPYRTTIIPISLKLVYSPWELDYVNPYFYTGGGAIHYIAREIGGGPLFTPLVRTKGLAAFIPAGVGLQVRLTDMLALETSAGYNFTLNDNIDYYFKSVGKGRDALWSAMIGITLVRLEGRSGDPDMDGLPNYLEKELGTKPNNPDTDGDGIGDGDEYKIYGTNPLRTDSDKDGLDDGSEIVRYKTNPVKSDSDDDGLTDYDEVFKYGTDPIKADTDDDDLVDGDEVLEFQTDPLKKDTDGDGLSDGDEVRQYLTDPTKRDTDGGGISDGEEVRRGSNPLRAIDDVRKEEIKVGRRIVLEGVTFRTGSAELTPGAVARLEEVFQTLRDNPGIEVEISGHTDNTGSRQRNIDLSLARADAVKTYLVSRGIEAFRLKVSGYGPDKPIAPNSTAEGRTKNRRIEFTRIK